MAAGSVEDVRHRVDELERRVRRLADRLRGTSLTRLSAPLPPHSSRASAAMSLAAALAAAAQGVEERDSPTPPPPRPLPDVGEHAVGDVLAATGYDLVRAARAGLGIDGRVWCGGERRSLTEALDAARAAVSTLHDTW